MMEHIDGGEGIVYVIDALDELRDKDAIDQLKAFIHECQRPGSPIVLITCRTDLCSIHNTEFDRFLCLQGFSEDQAFEYIVKYTENCQLEGDINPPPVLEVSILQSAACKHKVEVMLAADDGLGLRVHCLHQQTLT